MYKLLFLFLSLNFINLNDLVASNSETRTIVNPAYDLAKTGLFKISKIELSSIETRITLEFRVKPGWWVQYGADTFLSHPETGEKYTIIKLAEHDFNQKIYVDSTGFHSNVLIFNLLETGFEKIDYNDQFYGVSLTGEQHKYISEIPKDVAVWMDNELSKVKDDPLEDFEYPEFFNKKPARIIGYIKGYDARLGFDTGIFYASNEITWEDYPIVIDV